MIKSIAFCILIFIAGIWIGMLNGTVVEVEKIEKVKVRVPFFDFTKAECQLKKKPLEVCECMRCRLEIAANFIGESFQNKDEIDKLHQKHREETAKLHQENGEKIAKLHEQNKEEVVELHKWNKEEIAELHKRNKDELEKYEADIKSMYNSRKNEVEKLEYYWWTSGYKEGYRRARDD